MSQYLVLVIVAPSKVGHSFVTTRDIVLPLSGCEGTYTYAGVDDEPVNIDCHIQAGHEPSLMGWPHRTRV